jgi:hypothetical protein
MKTRLIGMQIYMQQIQILLLEWQKYLSIRLGPANKTCGIR